MSIRKSEVLRLRGRRLLLIPRKGFGLPRNMGLGLAGAIVGGLLFGLLGLLPGLAQPNLVRLTVAHNG